MRSLFLALSLVALGFSDPSPAPAQSGAYTAPEGVRSVVLQERGPRILVIEGAPPPGASNARNHWARGVRIYEKPHRQPFAAIAAQEVFEVEYKRSRGLIGVDKREMELISHEIESLVAARHYGFDLAKYEAWEAGPMVGYPHLRGMSEAEIVAAMRAMRPRAEAWLRANEALIRKLVDFRFPR